MRAIADARVQFYSSSGSAVACLNLIPVRTMESVAAAPLIEVDAEEARERGETAIQLRETESYEYEVVAYDGADLRLRCALSSRRKSIGNSCEVKDSGLIETRSFCGTLLMELVEGDSTDLSKSAIATALLDVRSVKINYRTEYRGMLRRISHEIAGLVVDARLSTKTSFQSKYEGKVDAGWLQIQLELLRETLDGIDFSAAMQRIFFSPHECLSEEKIIVQTDRPMRWTPKMVQQLVIGNHRRKLPSQHILSSKLGLNSAVDRVSVSHRSRSLDTMENRFVKFVLREFQVFLEYVADIFDNHTNWQGAAAMARRLLEKIESWLGCSFFCKIGELRFIPSNSPVLQRKAGYREILRWWLQFGTAAELSWVGGKELFHAGQRDVATLYEYWLFFELLDWFCEKCRGGERPAVEELIEGLENGAPNLRLRKKIELGPFVGVFEGQSRLLNARFAYNRRFDVTQDRSIAGSWTRRMHPDYTFSFWPGHLDEFEAEKQELLVHIHFDAKYRVENIEGLFGADGSNDSDEDNAGGYKRQDLLKMHAYRDAIKRSQGAYILYPGRLNTTVNFKGFHEILPGLGAFSIVPDENGEAHGAESLKKFLNEVLIHLSNRTTAQERMSYHVAESYVNRETLVEYGSLILAEQDVLNSAKRALPPSEQYVLVVYGSSQQHLAWILSRGMANVRLGGNDGEIHVAPEMTSVRHVLLQTKRGVLDKVLRITTAGYRLFTAQELISRECPGVFENEIHAVFDVVLDDAYLEKSWPEFKLEREIQAYEARKGEQQNCLNYHKNSGYKILTLQDLLRAL